MTGYRNIWGAIENYEDAPDGTHLVLVPPLMENHAVSDEEEGDDDVGLAGNINLPQDIAGGLEIHTGLEDDTTPAAQAPLNWKNTHTPV